MQVKQVHAMRVISRRDRLKIPQIAAHSGPAIDSLFKPLQQLKASFTGGGIIYIYRGCNGDPSIEFDLEICVPVAADLAAPSLPQPLELKSGYPCRVCESQSR